MSLDWRDPQPVPITLLSPEAQLQKVATLESTLAVLRVENERCRDYARQQEEGWRQATFENERLRALLVERHMFPDYPGPPDGEVSTVETIAEQEAWTEKWNDLDDRIREALANTV